MSVGVVEPEGLGMISAVILAPDEEVAPYDATSEVDEFPILAASTIERFFATILGRV